MSLAELFYAKQAQRRSRGWSRPRRRTRQPQRRKLLFEPLEPRLLLSSDLVHQILPDLNDLTLRVVEDEVGISMLQLVDNKAGTVVESQPLAETSRVVITGSEQDDTLCVDLDLAGLAPLPITFDGGPGNDTLRGPAGELTWTVTGRNAGSVGSIQFSDVEAFIPGAGTNTLGVIGYEVVEAAMDPQEEVTSALTSLFGDDGDVFGALGTGLEEFFTTLQAGFNDSFGRLPLVGEAFLEGGQFFSAFGEQLLALTSDSLDPGVPDPVQAVQNRLLDAFNPYVRDATADSVVNADDIVLRLVDDALEFRVHLGGEIVGDALDVGFDIGLDALGLKLALDGGLDLSMGWDIDLGFGFLLGESPSDGFFISTSDGNEAELLAKVALADGTTLTGQLGFLQLTATDIADQDDIDDPGNPGDLPNPEGHTGLFGSIGIDLRDMGYYVGDPTGRLTLGEMQEMPLRKMIVGTVNTGLDVNLHATVDFGSGLFPSINTDLDIDWDFFNVDTSEGDGDDGSGTGAGGSGEEEEGMFRGKPPEIAFNNVTLDLGSFISDLVGPVLSEVQKVTQPIQPIIDILTMELPVISDLAGPTTLLDLARIFGGSKFNSGYIEAVRTVLGLVEMVNSLDASADISIEFGDFPLTGVDLRDEDASLSDAQTVLPAFDLGARLNEQATSQSTKNFIASLEGGGLMFPILTDPGTVFSLLTGNTVDLFRYEMPNLKIDFGYGQTFYILPGLEVKLEGNVGAAIDLDFGFDTRGIQEFADKTSPLYLDPAAIFDGFYLDDHVAAGVDSPELTLYAGIQGKAELNVVVLAAGVSGGVFADVNFNLSDPDQDGKLRGSEFVDLIQLGPEYLFSLDGAVWAGLDAYIWAGIDLGWFGKITFWEESFNIFDVTLVDFEFDPFDPPPAIATLTADGTLRLNMGPNADSRLSGITADENVIVRHVIKDGIGTIVVQGAGYTEQFAESAVSRIYADAGTGDDTILIGQGVMVPVELHGGDGDDRLEVLGAGPAMLFGDAGNDVLIGGAGDDVLEGGEGDDLLNGRAGADSLSGGLGNDQYFWDAGTGADTFTENATGGDRDQITVGGGKRQLSSTTAVPRYVDRDDRITAGTVEEGGVLKARVDAAVDGSNQTIILDNIEVLSLAPGGGADTVTLNDLTGTDVTTLGVNLGQGDRGEADVVVFNGSVGDDTITAEGGLQVVGSVDGEVAYDEVVKVSDTTGGSQRIVYIQDSDPSRDRLTVRGIEGNDALTAGSGGDGIRLQDLIHVTLDGGEGNDLLTTVYGNADVAGGPGDDTLVLTDDINSPGRADIRLDDDHVAVYRGGTLAHLISYSEIESLRLDLGPDDTGNDLTVLSSIPGPVTINGSAGDDLVKVIGLQGPLTVNGEGGGIDELVIDRTGDINGLTGELTTNALAALGFPAAITYTGVEQLTVNLGSGADAFTIQGTSTDTTVNAGQGADQVIVHATGGRTTVNGDGDEDTLSLEIADASDLTAFSDLTFSVETLRLDHTGNEATAWRVEDGAIWAGTVEVVGTEGSDRLFIAGNGQGDTLDVTDNVPDQQTVAIEGNTVEVQHGATALAFEDALPDPLPVLSPVFDPTGQYLYTIGGTGLGDKIIETYARDTESGRLSLQEKLQRLWIKQAELIASDGDSGDWLGSSVAIDGDTAVAGAPGDDLYGLVNVGSAYVYQWEPDESGVWTWRQSAKLTAPDGTGRLPEDDPYGLYGDSFGQSVAISGDTIFVGAEQDDDRRGSVYVFKRDSNGDGIEDWGFVKKITISDRNPSDLFGGIVAVSDDTLVVGAPGDDAFAGAAYLFTRDANGDGIEDWGFVKKLAANDRASGDIFGAVLAISGDTVMIGAVSDNDHNGSVYVFQRDANRDGVVDWGLLKKLTPPPGSVLDSFGAGIAIDGSTAVIGAPDYWSGPGPGVAYIYHEQTPGDWQLEATLAAADGEDYNNFGMTVAIKDDVIFVSARSYYASTFAAYIFEQVGAGQWAELAKLTGDSYDMFGYDYGLSGDRVIIGATGDSDKGFFSGSASVFLDTDVVAGAATMVVSPDGANLYLARPDRDTLSVFVRDAATGTLTFMEEMTDQVHLEGVDLVRVNVDGSLVYAATDNGLSVLSRDPVSGRLTFQESVGTGSLRRVTGLEMSADGRFVYVTGEGNLLRTYSPSNTTLTQCDPDVAISHPAMLALSPDGVNLYVARPADNAITVFTREATTGLLTYLQEVRNGVHGVRGLDGVRSLTVTEDYVFAAGEGDDALVAFRREDDGRLTFAQLLRNRSGGVLGLENPTSIVVSPDGKYLYTASRGEGASPGGVAWFRIEPSVIPAPPLIVGYSGIEALTVTTAGADDLLSVREVAIPLAVETGGGADSVSLYGSLTGSTTEVRLGAGDDFLEVRSTGPNATTSIFGEAGEDVIQVWNTGNSATTLIDSGVGGDLIEVAGDGLSAPVSVSGGDPSALPGDVLVFSGEADTLLPSTPDGEISAGGSVVVSFQGLEQVHFLTAPPQAGAGGPYTLQEGGSLTLNGSGSVIPSGQSLVSVKWDLDGDGRFGDLVGFTPAPLSWTDLQALGLGDDGTYQVAIRVTTDVGSDIDSATVAIVNTPPTLSITGAAAVDEDQPYTLHLSALDPGEDTISGWTIDWGDGTIEEILSHPPSVTHVYNYREDPYPISASAADEDGVYGPVSTTVLVNDVPPVQALTGEDSVSEGEIYTLGLNAVSTAGDTVEQWIIDWGDGSAKEILNTRAATLNHVFPDDSAREEDGVFKIRATAIDEDGIYSAIKTVIVANVAPTLVLTGDSYADEGARYTLGLSSEDPGNDSIVGWSIDWGDGTTDAVTGDVHTVEHVYKDGYAKYDITGTATDEDGTYGSPMLSVEVEDVSPDTAVSGAQIVGEGAFYTLSIDPATDPGDDTVTQYIIDWGDGTIESVAPPAALASGFMPRLSASHVYGDEDDLTGPISISLVDEDGTHAGVATLAVQVRNMPPVADAGGGKTVKEGEWVDLNGAFTDPGSKDTHTFLWQVSADNGQVVPDGTGQDFSFTPADNGVYTATFTVTDNDGGVGTDAVVIRVTNIVPSIEISGEAIAVESQPYSLTLGPVSDPGEDTVTRYTVHWGDGMSDEYDTGGEKSHTYSTPGVTQAIRVDLADEDGAYANVAGMDLLVVSAAPEITSLSLDQTLIDENDTVTLTGEFEQLGLVVEHSVMVDWGDGTTGTLALQPGENSFTIEHQYRDDPTGTPSDEYIISVTVADNDGDTDSGTLTLTVLNVAPMLSEVSATGVVENGFSTLTGTIIDPGTLDAFTLTVDWGDGTRVEHFTYVAGTTVFNETHQYLDDNPTGTPADTYAICLMLSDDDEGKAAANTTLTVSNVAPEVISFVSSAPEVGDAKPGDVVTVSGLFTDVGTLDTHAAVIDWGDGTVIPAMINQAAGSFSGTHAYATGGIFDIKVMLADDDLGRAEASATALVTGARIQGGELQVVGTRGNDCVSINEEGRKLYKVHADFLPGRCHFLTFNVADVEHIRILLGDGDDHAQIAGSISLPVLLNGGPGGDHLHAGRGPTTMLGGPGNDLLVGGAGKDLLDGGAGDDRIFGAGGDDTIRGGEGNDSLSGGPGDDRLEGGPGNDRLRGGAGTDQMFGDAGDDVFVWRVADGEDRIDGGEGCDTALVVGSQHADRISVTADGPRVQVVVTGRVPCDPLLLSGVEALHISTGAGADTITFGNLAGTPLAAISVDAGAGDDWVDAGALPATIALTVRGGPGDDTLRGGAGDDLLIGGSGCDRLDGGPGTNRLIQGDVPGNGKVHRSEHGHRAPCIGCGGWQPSSSAWKDGRPQSGPHARPEDRPRIDWAGPCDGARLQDGANGHGVQPLDLVPGLVDFTVAAGNGNGKHDGNRNGNGNKAALEPGLISWGSLNGKDRRGLEVVEFDIALEPKTV